MEPPRSYLSPYIQELFQIVRRDNEIATIPAAPLVIGPGLDLIGLNEIIPSDYDASQDWFKLAVSRIRGLLVEASSAWTKSLFDTTLKQGVFNWAANQDMMEHLWSILNTRDAVKDLEYLLTLTPLLERALGDILFTIKLKIAGKNNNTCDKTSVMIPSLMRDLIVSAELEELMGLPFIRLLQILLGSPLSLNVRNLVWHGFLLPGELPPRLLPIFLSIIATIGGKIQENKIMIVRRNLCAIGQVVRIQEQVLSLNKYETTQELCRYIREILKTQNIPNEELIHYVVESNISECHGGRLIAVLFGLPLLESLLRHLYVVVNDCPDRMVTAESAELYTTITEIFSFETTGGAKNCLIEHLGTDLTELCMDLLVLPAGPRLRDRFGHGEIDLTGVFGGKGSFAPGVLDQVDHQASLAILDYAAFLTLLLIKTVLQIIGNMTKNTNAPKEPNKVVDIELKYCSLYHPISQLLQNISRTLHLVTELHDLIFIVDREKEKYETVEGFKPSVKATKILTHDINLSCQSVLKVCSEHRPLTLHRPRSELELVRLLALIAEAEIGALINTLNTFRVKRKDYLAKTLRSRQRSTYLRMEEILPRLSVAMFELSSRLLAWTQTIQEGSDVKTLKMLLTHLENITSAADIGKNKWEVVELHLSRLEEIMESQ